MTARNLIGWLIIVDLVKISQGWNNSYQSEDDHNVLTIFLPILAVAILLCAGGCCYFEKRRKKRLKKNAGAPVESDFSDTESVMTTSSSRYRPYLLPTATTGRTYRTSSRAGSMRGSLSSRGSPYEIESSYGEPPPYNGSKSLDNRRLSRSKSMLDVRNDQQNQPIRRTRSTLSLNNRYQGRDANGSKSPSPTASEWSVRTAPQIGAYEGDYDATGRAMSVASLPVGGRRGKLRRSASQPNLSRTPKRTGTYPQGILKRNGAGFADDTAVTSNHTATSADSGMYGDDENQYQDAGRPSSRPPSAYGSARGYYQGYPQGGAGNPPGYNDQQVYAITPSVAYPQYQGEWNGAYTANYDPYAYNGSYWDDQNGGGGGAYTYGSMIY